MTMPAPEQSREVSRDNGKGSETQVRIVFNEMGTSGLKQSGGFVTEAYNSALQFPQVIPLYTRLRQSMPEIVMIRRAFSAWSGNVKPVVNLPDEPGDDDKRYQDYLQSEFENWEGGFHDFIEQCVNYVPFMGWAWWDVQPAIRNPNWKPPDPDDEWRSELDDGLIGLRRIAWRDHSTFHGWIFDDNKRVKGMRQHDFPNPPIDLPLQHSLHITFGGSHNPEGYSPLEAVWRLERIKYGLEVIQGMGFEHAAGHLSVKKIEKGDISAADKTNVASAAKAILSAQEGNYAIWPFGLDGNVVDIPFSVAGSILEAIRYYGILVLSIYSMQFIALNTMTQTGAMASQVDSTNTAVYSFNAMLDGMASQFDDQVGKRLWLWNRNSFPGATRRPKITFSHIENTLDLGALGSFFSTIYDKMPIGMDDYEAVRRRAGWMPEKTPDDALEEWEAKKKAANAARDRLASLPKNPDGTLKSNDKQMNDTGEPMSGEEANSKARKTIEQALKAYSRATRSW